MSGSKTKQETIDRHLANDLLQAPFLPVMARSDVQDLSVEYPTVAPDPDVVADAALALEQGNTHYVDVPGIAALRDALAAFLGNMGAQGYESPNVLVTAGVQESRFLTIQKIGENWERIGLPAVVHPGARKALGVRPMPVVTLSVDEETLLPTLDGIRDALAAGCKLLYLESPSRLSGAIYDRAAVERIGALLVEYDAHAIWDQGLSPWVAGTDYLSLGSLPGMAERVALIGDGFPGMGLESWFVGYVAARPDWEEPMRSQKQIMAICTSTATQFAAVKAAELFPAHRARHLPALKAAKDQMLAQADEQGVGYLPGDVTTLVAFRGLDGAALRANGFAAADGADFGAPGVLRLTVTTDGSGVQALSTAARQS